MKPYRIEGNGILDLEHLLFVGDVFEDYSWTRPYLFHIQFAFDVNRNVGFDDEKDAVAAHAALITAWTSK